MRSYLRTIIVAALAVGLLALFLRNANLADVWSRIQQGRPDLLLLAIGTTMLTYVLRSLRWQWLLKPIGETRFTNAFRTTVIGFAASFLLPARAGEFLRPYLLARRESLRATAAFATVVIERLLDTVTVLILLVAFVFLFDPGMGAVDGTVFEAIKVGGLLLGAGTAAALGVVFWLAGHPTVLLRLQGGIERIVPSRLGHRAAGLVHTFAEGLAVVRQPRRLAVSLLLSFPLWLSIAFGIWIVTLAFHTTIPYTGSFLLMSLLVVGVAVPTPGAVGGFHMAYRIGATAFYHMDQASAIGAGIVLHAISFVPVTILGIIFMAQEGMSLGRMRTLVTEASAADEGTP
jgi:hypothetical protein